MTDAKAWHLALERPVPQRALSDAELSRHSRIIQQLFFVRVPLSAHKIEQLLISHARMFAHKIAEINSPLLGAFFGSFSSSWPALWPAFALTGRKFETIQDVINR